MPRASVVICFHGTETLTRLLHTLHSLVQHSPAQLLHEIVLIADNSKTGKRAPPSCTINVHHHRAPSMCTTIVHHHCAPPSCTTIEHHHRTTIVHHHCTPRDRVTATIHTDRVLFTCLTDYYLRTWFCSNISILSAMFMHISCKRSLANVRSVHRLVQVLFF